jgi:hypothetical protein
MRPSLDQLIENVLAGYAGGFEGLVGDRAFPDDPAALSYGPVEAPTHQPAGLDVDREGMRHGLGHGGKIAH